MVHKGVIGGGNTQIHIDLMIRVKKSLNSKLFYLKAPAWKLGSNVNNDKLIRVCGAEISYKTCVN